MPLTTDFEQWVRRDEPLAPHTWFRLGGPAQYFAEPSSVEELQAVVERCRDEGLQVLAARRAFDDFGDRGFGRAFRIGAGMAVAKRDGCGGQPLDHGHDALTRRSRLTGTRSAAASR